MARSWNGYLITKSLRRHILFLEPGVGGSLSFSNSYKKEKEKRKKEKWGTVLGQMFCFIFINIFEIYIVNYSMKLECYGYLFGHCLWTVMLVKYFCNEM